MIGASIAAIFAIVPVIPVSTPAYLKIETEYQSNKPSIFKTVSTNPYRIMAIVQIFKKSLIIYYHKKPKAIGTNHKMLYQIKETVFKPTYCIMFESEFCRK